MENQIFVENRDFILLSFFKRCNMQIFIPFKKILKTRTNVNVRKPIIISISILHQLLPSRFRMEIASPGCRRSNRPTPSHLRNTSFFKR